MAEIVVKHAVNAADIASCLAIREKVFIVEQKVPVGIERDEYDATAIHFLATEHGHPIGTARAVLKDDGRTAKLGRIAVLGSHRGQGVGKAIMAAIEIAPELETALVFHLASQTHALRFYTSLGYTEHGDEFSEAGIPHRSMTKHRALADRPPPSL